MADFRLTKTKKDGKPATEKVSPEKAQSLLSKGAGLGLSSLHTIGSVLSAPSRGLWGTANAALGHKDGFGGIHPLDSTDGIELSGFLANAGLIAHNDKKKWEILPTITNGKINPGDIGRGLLDIVGDPLTYTGVGGLTKLGVKALKSEAGVRKGLDAFRHGDRAIVSLKVPFTKIHGHLGTGPVVADAIANAAKRTGLTRVGNAIGNSSAMVGLKKRFSTAAMERTTAPTQRWAAGVYPLETRAREGEAFRGISAARDVELAGLGTDEYQKALRGMGEAGINADPTGALSRQLAAKDAAFNQATQLGIGPGEIRPQWEKAMERHGRAKSAEEYTLNALNEIQHVRQNAAPVGKSHRVPGIGDLAQHYPTPGSAAWNLPRQITGVGRVGGVPHATVVGHDQSIPLSELVSATVLKPAVAANQHVPRSLATNVKYGGTGTGAGSRPSMTLTASQDAAREKVFGGVKHGTEAINDAFSGLANAKASSGLPALEALRSLPYEKQVRAAGKIIEGKLGGPQKFVKKYREGSTRQNRASSLGDLAVQNPQLAQAGLFNNAVQGDLARYTGSLAGRNVRAEGIHDFIGGQARLVHKGDLGESLDELRKYGFGSEHLPTVKNVAGALGIDHKIAAQHLLQRLPPQELAAVQSVAMREAARKGTRPRAELRRQALQMQIPAKEAHSLLGAMEHAPKTPDPSLMSRYMDIFKANVLAQPSTQIRNAASGALQGALHGHLTPNSLNNAQALLRGGKVTGIAAKNPHIRDLMNSGQIGETEAVRRLFGTHFPAQSHNTFELPVDQVGTKFNDIVGNVPGRSEIPAGDVLKKPLAALFGYQNGEHVGAGFLNPFDVEKAGHIAASNMFANTTEKVNRGAGFMGLLEQGYHPSAAAREVKNAQVDYSDFTNFERQYMKNWLPFYCVPTDHEILTRDGWKTYDNLVIGEEVLGYDLPTGDLRWVPLEAVNVFPFDGPINTLRHSRNVRAKNRDYFTVEFLFTDDHRWPTFTQVQEKVLCSKNGSRTSITGGLRRFKAGSELRAGQRIPCAGNYTSDIDQETSLSPRLAKILGWVVTDGHHRWRGNHLEMVVYQSPNKFLKDIIDLLGSTPRKPHPETGVVCVPVQIDDVKELKKVFTSKSDLSKIVSRLSGEAAEAMWQAMVDAEGCASGPGLRSMHFAQSATTGVHVRDAFQILCTLTGRSANISRGGCYVKRAKFYHVGTSISRTHFVGDVWCPTTSLGTWVMRHNGAMIITGNSFSKKMLGHTAEELASNPGGPTAQIVKAQDRALSHDASLPDSVSSGMAIPLGISADGTKKILSAGGAMHEPAVNLLGSLLGGNTRGALYDIGGMLHPVPKTALEHMTGQSFYQRGEPQQNLDPNVGRTLANVAVHAGMRDPNAGPVKYPGSSAVEMALGLSPFGPLASKARMLSDTRKNVLEKALSLLSGVKITDVSPKKQEYTLLRRAEQLAKESGAKSRADVYFSAKELEQLDKTDPVLAAKQRELQSLLKAIKPKSAPKTQKAAPKSKSGDFRLQKAKKK